MQPPESLSNIDIVIYALYKLDGATQIIHTERIAWEAYCLSEERFSWSLPEFRKRAFPDKTVARYALEDAKKLRLISGRAGRDKGGKQSEGWQLTPAGLEWFLKNEERIKNALGQKEPISRDLHRHQAERFIKKLYSDRIFKLYQKEKSLDQASIYDFTDMLNCSPDASREIINQKFKIFKNMVISINSAELKDFLSKCEEMFRNLLNGEEEIG